MVAAGTAKLKVGRTWKFTKGAEKQWIRWEQNF